MQVIAAQLMILESNRHVYNHTARGRRPGRFKQHRALACMHPTGQDLPDASLARG